MGAPFKMRRSTTAPLNDGDWEDLGAQPVAVAPSADDEWEYSQPTNNRTTTPPVTPPAQPGFLRGMWDSANTPIADSPMFASNPMKSNAGATKRAVGNLGGDVASVLYEGAALPARLMGAKPNNPVTFDRDFASERDAEEAEMQRKAARGEAIPASDRFRHFAFGVGDSAENVVSSLTTPLSLATAAFGGVAKAGLGKLSEAARAFEAATGLGFAGHGAYDAVAGGDRNESLPDKTERVLTDLSMVAGGGAGAIHGAKGNPGQKPYLKGSLASREVPETGGMTRGDLYRNMADQGVDLSLGQAGGGKFANWVEDKAENTPGGSGRMARFKEKQHGQMRDAMTRAEDTVDPSGKGRNIDEQGDLVQKSLETAQDVAHTNASDAFKKTLGDLVYTTADTSDIAQGARDLRARLQSGQISSLQPKAMIDLLNEIEKNYGDLHNNKSMIDDLFRDRSRLMKTHFSDALVSGEGEAAARQMAKIMRDSLEKASMKSVNQHVGGSTTTTNRQAQFNDAMKGWSDYHETFGDRNSPIVRALREGEPSKVIDKFIGNKGSLRAVKMLKQVAPEFVNVLKREFIRRMYDTNDTGVRENIGNMQNRLLHFNEPFVKELFTPEELSQLRANASAGKAMKLDINPSGSGRYQGQGAAAATVGGGVGAGATAAMLGHPVAGAVAAGTAAAVPVASNIASRVMTARPIVDYFMGYDRPAPSKGSLSSRTASAAPAAKPAAGGKAIANPFGQKQSTGRQGRNSQAGFAAPGAIMPGFDWLMDKLVGEGATGKEITGVKKTQQKIVRSLDPKSLEATALAIADRHNNNFDPDTKSGGSTTHLAHGDMFGKDAFAVSAYPELTEVVKGEKITPDDVKKFLSDPKRQAVLKSDPRTSVGTWTTNGKTVMDIVATPSDLKVARDLGRRFNQESIFDLQNGREIKAGGQMPHDELLKIANTYGEGGLTHSESFDPDPRRAQIADAYDAMVHNPNDPKVKASYDALIKETAAQWEHLKKNGFTMSMSDEQPYQTAEEMLKDIRDNKHITVWSGGEPPSDHPLSGKGNSEGVTHNTLFRAVHDIMGHAIGGHDFSELGEENAFMKHSKMYSKDAIPALATETRGQASWFFNNKGVREGAPLGNFPEQKAALLPEEFHGRESTPIEGRLKDLAEPKKIAGVHYSNEEGLTELDPKFYGKNMVNEANGQPMNRPDIARRASFPDQWADETYLGREDSPEFRQQGAERFGTRKVRYNADLNSSRIYDMLNDPDGIRNQVKQELLDNARKKFGVTMTPSEAEIDAHAIAKLRELGYSGRTDVNGLVASWDKVPVTKDIVPPRYDVLMHPEERARLMVDNRLEQFVAAVKDIPEVRDLVEVAKAGQANRKWYQRSGKAFDALVEAAPDYFDPELGDRNRFSDVMASLSGNTFVEQNLRDGLKFWKRWVDEGRPTDRKAIEKIMRSQFDRSTRVISKDVPSKIGKVVAAINGESMYPEIKALHYFKIANFADNLRAGIKSIKEAMASTNDRHHATLMGIDGRPSAAPLYHAMSVVTRQVAKQLGWEPMEAQAAMWPFARLLTDMSDVSKGKMPSDLVGKITPEQITKYGGDFADILRSDPESQSILKKLGVDVEQLNQKLEAIERPAESNGIANADQGSLDRVARSIDRTLEKRKGLEPTERNAEVQDEGPTDFNPETFDEQPEQSSPRSSGVVPAEKLHYAELGNWKAVAGASENAVEAGKIGETVAYTAKRAARPNIETFVNRRGGKSLGVLQIDTYGADKGYPITIDWLATHPDVIEGKIAEKGIGTELMHQAIQRAADLGVGIQLQSARGARTFYEKMGMKPSETFAADHYVYTPEQVQDLASRGDRSASVKAKAKTANMTAPKDDEQYVYHVTTTPNAKKIAKQGIRPMQTSNWVQAADKSRYGAGEVYAFEHPDDAARWAAKMDWEFNRAHGTGKVSIVKAKRGEIPWQQDTSDPLGQHGRSGNWLKVMQGVPKDHIVESTPFDAKAMQDWLKRRK
jgi:GNAT superfamily N-acetyltransferase